MMPKFCLRLHSVATLALLTLTCGCSSISLPKIIDRSRANSATGSVVSAQSPSTCPKIDPFTKAIDKAQRAAILAQSAQSKQQWDAVVSQWIHALKAMQSIPPESPRRAFAQKKVVEYLRNLDIAQQKATTTSSQLPFTSFDNQLFDEQLLLYLSYVSAIGKPDVLIVGSSRALVGVDSTQLQQALASQGKRGLKIFNFGVNGGTAQLIDFQLRQLLTREQLPRLIIWADGLRAFNGMRTDRTYNNLIVSAGYKRLMAGDRPKLAQTKPEITNTCEAIPSTSTSNVTKPKSNATSERWRILPFQTTSRSLPFPSHRLLLTQLTEGPVPQRLTIARNPTGYSSFAIDANGFLPMDSRFDPKIYYQQNPQVSGQYDSDYQPFSLTGNQSIAFNSIKAFAKAQKIPLVFVSLPLTQNYLDELRQSREQQFQQFMQRQVGEGFVYIDLNRQWLNQNQYFTDPSHLNRYGAAAMSNQLAANRQIPWPQSHP